MIAAVAFLFGGSPPPLEPHFRAAAPKGWIVEGKQEGRIEWMRFSESIEMEGEDYAGNAITLYRIEVDRAPEEAGDTLTREKLDKQGAGRKDAVDRDLKGIRWRGFEADYASESGAPRREAYLYAVKGRKTLYLFWARGALGRFRDGSPQTERSLQKVSEAISGNEPEPDGAVPEVPRPEAPTAGRAGSGNARAGSEPEVPRPEAPTAGRAGSGNARADSEPEVPRGAWADSEPEVPRGAWADSEPEVPRGAWAGSEPEVPRGAWADSEKE